MISLSIVSHGHGSMLATLLDDLESLHDVEFEVIVTLNIPEAHPVRTVRPFPVRIIVNKEPKGFGANHNAAFALAGGQYFAVLNPDLRAPGLRLAALLDLFADRVVGAVGPAVQSPGGTAEDNARRFPTVLTLLRKVVLRVRELDYQRELAAGQACVVDWLAGMFLLFRREAFASVAGFDERYYLYYEDVDICWRLRAKGWSVVLQPSLVVIHDAQRASHRKLRFLRWHMASALRFLTRRR